MDRDSDLVRSRYGGYVPIRIAMHEDEYDREYGDGYSSNYSSSTNSTSNKKAQKEKEMKANIPIRALMLNELFDDDLSLLHLPKLPLELWNIIGEYEGGVESSMLGQGSDNADSFWCIIL